MLRQLRQIGKKAIDFLIHAGRGFAAQIGQQIVNQNQARLAGREQALQRLFRGGAHEAVIFGDEGEGVIAAQLKGEFAPRRFAHRLAALAAAPFRGIEGRADKGGEARGGERRHARLREQARHARPFDRLAAEFDEMMEQQQSMRFAAAVRRGDGKNRAVFAVAQ